MLPTCPWDPMYSLWKPPFDIKLFPWTPPPPLPLLPVILFDEHPWKFVIGVPIPPDKCCELGPWLCPVPQPISAQLTLVLGDPEEPGGQALPLFPNGWPDEGNWPLIPPLIPPGNPFPGMFPGPLDPDIFIPDIPDDGKAEGCCRRFDCIYIFGVG